MTTAGWIASSRPSEQPQRLERQAEQGRIVGLEANFYRRTNGGSVDERGEFAFSGAWQAEGSKVAAECAQPGFHRSPLGGRRVTTQAVAHTPQEVRLAIDDAARQRGMSRLTGQGVADAGRDLHAARGRPRQCNPCRLARSVRHRAERLRPARRPRTASAIASTSSMPRRANGRSNGGSQRLPWPTITGISTLPSSMRAYGGSLPPLAPRGSPRTASRRQGCRSRLRPGRR